MAARSRTSLSTLNVWLMRQESVALRIPDSVTNNVAARHTQISSPLNRRPQAKPPGQRLRIFTS